MKKPVIGLNCSHATLEGYKRHNLRDHYINAVYDLGGVPLMIPALPDEEVLGQYLDMVDGMVLTGGEDYPSAMYHELPHPELKPCSLSRAETDGLLAKMVLQRNLPTLGICAGMQLLNIVRGGKLIQHIDAAGFHTGENYHFVIADEGNLLDGIFSSRRWKVNSNHHQALDPNAIGEGLKIIAYSEDGVIEAIESVDHPFVLGVQWHPERIVYPVHRNLIFGTLIARAADYAARLRG